MAAAANKNEIECGNQCEEIPQNLCYTNPDAEVVEALPHQKSSYNLFTDEKLKSMFDGLPQSEKDSYKKSGQYMYSYDYVNKGNPEDTILEAVAYINEGLKSGLRPSQLDSSEIQHLRSVYGEKWYERYGYTSEQD